MKDRRQQPDRRVGDRRAVDHDELRIGQGKPGPGRPRRHGDRDRIPVCIPVLLAEAVRHLAAARRVSISEYVVDLIAEHAKAIAAECDMTLEDVLAQFAAEDNAHDRNDREALQQTA